jgi:hypothetical protein
MFEAITFFGNFASFVHDFFPHLEFDDYLVLYINVLKKLCGSTLVCIHEPVVRARQLHGVS